MLTSISQSMIHEFKRCQKRFFLKYVDPVDHPMGGGSSLPAEAGTAFDAYCRSHLERQIVLDDELVNRDGTPLSTEAIEWGRYIYQCYQESRAMDFLKELGVAYVGREKTSLLIQKQDESGKLFHRETPFAGIPDLLLRTGQVDDWKTSGVGSAKGKSPKKNWTRLWVPVGEIAGKKRWAKKRAINAVLLEDIDQRWAFQLCSYNFLMGHLPGYRAMKGGIHAAFVKGREVTFAYYEGRISELFQWQVWNTIHDTWQIVQSGDFDPPKYSKYKCNMWGRTCEVADRCIAYQRQITLAKEIEGTWLAKMKR